MTAEKTKPLEISNENFDKEVLKSKRPVLLDFWAEWCMPCKMLDPVIDDIAAEYAKKLRVGKVNTDDNREISLKYEVSAIPTLILLVGGEMVRKFIGLQQKADLVAAIEDVLGE